MHYFHFISICFIHHFERLGNRMDLFNSYWFTVVTFSTVGYGDITPGHWTGKLFLTIFIIIALVYLPSKVCVYEIEVELKLSSLETH